MPSIRELLSGHVTLEVECLDRLYLNGYIGSLATSGGLVTFMREQLGKPIPSPVVLGQNSERFREAVRTMAEREGIPIIQFNHGEKKDKIANRIRQERRIQNGIVFHRSLVADLLGVTTEQYTASQMTYDLRRLRLKGLIFRPSGTNRYFVTPCGWKMARLFSRLEARVFRPAMAMFTATDALLPFPLRQAVDRVDTQLDNLIYEAFPLAEGRLKLDTIQKEITYIRRLEQCRDCKF